MYPKKISSQNGIIKLHIKSTLMFGNRNNSACYYHDFLITVLRSDVRLSRLLLSLAIRKTSTNCLQIIYFWQRKIIATEKNWKDL